MKRLIVASVLMIVSLLTLVGCKQGLSSASYEALGPVKTIEVSEVIGNVKIEKTDEEVVSVSYNEISGAYYTTISYDEENESLVVRRKDARTSFQKGEFKTDAYITVYVPKENTPDVKIDVNTGNVTLVDGAYGNLSINVVLGNISLNEIESNELNLETKTGNINGDEITCEKLIYKNTYKGETQFYNVDAKESIEGDVYSGSIGFDGVKSKIITLKAQNSNANFDGVEVEERLSLNITTGNIDLALKGRQNDYTIVAKSGTDTASNMNTGTGDISVNLNTTVGIISVNYSR